MIFRLKHVQTKAQGGRRGMSHDQRIDGVVQRQHPLLQDAEEDDDEIQVVPGPIPQDMRKAGDKNARETHFWGISTSEIW